MGQSGLERLAPVTTRIEMAGWRKNIKQDSSFKKTGKGLTGHHKGPCPLIVVTRRPFLSRLFIYFPDFVHLSKKEIASLFHRSIFDIQEESSCTRPFLLLAVLRVCLCVCVCNRAVSKEVEHTRVSLLSWYIATSIFSRPAAFPPASRSPILLVQLNTIHLSSRHIISNYFGALDAMNRVPSQSEIDGNVLTSWIHSIDCVIWPLLFTELRTAFILMDSDRDGRVTAVEIQSMLQQLGICLREDIVLNLVRQASQSGK